MPSNMFYSNVIENIRNNGGSCLLPDGRLVRLPAAFGFCSGVMGAVGKLSKALGQYPGRRIWLLGAMIHNPAVNDWFSEQGVSIQDYHHLENVFEIASPDDVFVIPAFGLPEEVDERLRAFVSRTGVVVDATCPFVRRVWAAAIQAGKRGEAVLIHGKAGHQETEAIWSRACRNAPASVILTSPVDARTFRSAAPASGTEIAFHPELLPDIPWSLVNQTTMLAGETAEIAGILQHTPWHSTPLHVTGTLCTATQERQKAARELCQRGCNVILVLGGTDSSNTTQLYRLARTALGKESCFFLEKPENITPEIIAHFDPELHAWQQSPADILNKAAVIGILAGASCPDSELEKLLFQLTMPQENKKL